MKIDTKELYDSINSNRIIRSCELNPGDYKSVSFEGLRADNITFEGSDFSESNLNSVNIRYSIAKKVIFDKASINSATMRMCEFGLVSFNGADFSDSAFENCKAQGCYFEKSKFVGASITDSDFNRASFNGADLTNTNASYCNMRGVDFRGAKLIKTNFRDADLRGADFTGAHLEEVDFAGANIEGALFDEKVNRGETDLLAEIVDPVARNIVKAGSRKKLFNEDQAMVELDNVIQSVFGSGKNNNSDSGINNEINKIMTSAANVGIGPLLDSLQQREGEPPDAVKRMIEDLMKSSDLPKNATTEDLLSSLLSMVNKK